MVRRFDPDVKTEYGCGMYDGDEYHEAVMKEGEHGKWVKLETFEHVTTGHISEIAKLKKHVATLQAQIGVLKGDVRVGPHLCASCDSRNTIAIVQLEQHKLVCGTCHAEGPGVALGTDDWETKIIRMWNKRQERARKKHRLENPVSYAQLMGDSEILPPGSNYE